MDVFMKKLLIIPLSAILIMSGCASMNELTDEVIKARSTGKEGVTRVYPITEKQAWHLTETVLRWEKTDKIEVHKEKNYLVACTGMQMVAFGSVLGVWIEPVDSEHTMLTVVTRRRAGDNFTKLTASRFYERFEQGVEIIKTGMQLPVFAHEERKYH